MSLRKIKAPAVCGNSKLFQSTEWRALFSVGTEGLFINGVGLYGELDTRAAII